MLTNVKPPTELSELIAQRLEERGLGIKELSILVDITYEHARRIVRGEGVPSRPVLKLISQELGLNGHQLEKLAATASILKKYGNIPLELAGKNPELASIERAWISLNPEQKQTAIDMITGWAKRNKALG